MSMSFWFSHMTYNELPELDLKVDQLFACAWDISGGWQCLKWSTPQHNWALYSSAQSLLWDASSNPSAGIKNSALNYWTCLTDGKYYGTEIITFAGCTCPDPAEIIASPLLEGKLLNYSAWETSLSKLFQISVGFLPFGSDALIEC